jgi:ParB family transcriptional regulator, chromosome partitioning protein
MQLEFHQIATPYEKLRMRIAGVDSRLMSSLAQNGQLNPVLVVASESEAAGYVLIDGYRRISALRRLGRDTVQALQLSLSESAALIFWYCQQTSLRRCALSDGWFIRELIQLHAINQSEISKRLQRSQSWVSRRLSLVTQLPESVQQQVRLGELSAWAASKYFVPLARAKRVDCEQLAANMSGQRLSARQIHRIYIGYKRGDSEQRSKIASDPILYLKASQALERTYEDKDNAEQISALVEDMEILSAVSSRARRRIRALSEPVVLPQPVILAWQAARASIAALNQTAKENSDAR